MVGWDAARHDQLLQGEAAHGRHLLLVDHADTAQHLGRLAERGGTNHQQLDPDGVRLDQAC
jgi:hypothetical protein